MNRRDKRGISDIVTTVLLVLLAIAAVGIIWVVIQNFINTGTKGIGSTADCLQNNFDIVSAYNVSTTSFNVTVKRITGQSSIEKLSIYHTTSGQTTKVADSTNVPLIGESKTITINPSITLKSGDTVQIAAVIGGNSCSPSDAKIIIGI